MNHLIRKQHARVARRKMGSLSSSGLGSLGDTASTIADAATVTAEISGDPYFGEMLCHAKQLVQISKGKAPQDCVQVPLGVPGGIGLRYAVVPARGFVFAQQHPVTYILAGLVVLGLPMAIGYAIGRSKGSP